MNCFDKLKTELAELFQLDQADLDFGIYRIMNARRDEITRFLERDLLPQEGNGKLVLKQLEDKDQTIQLLAMPRQLRFDARGNSHRAMDRGIDRTGIIRSSADRKDFLNRLSDLCREGALIAHA